MHFIIGTAGHIDHGKSSLVRALTGIDPDRLPEEKKRGVTIELGFAHLSLAKHEIGIIDVPGHADFINNMVSGVSALNLAVFIVAADDAWMPQSEEHLHILHYLGIKNVIIALTKIDVCEDVEFTTELVRDELQGTLLEEAPIIPVSSITGEGIDQLKEEILEKAKTITFDIKGHFPRLHVDRVFSPKGVGTVVTGTLMGASVNTGETMMCYPHMDTSSIRHIQAHKTNTETLPPGSRTGLNLPDLALDTPGKPGIKRGCSLTPVDQLTLTKYIDVKIERLNRSIVGQSATKRALKNAETVILHIGTARLKARVILLDRTTLSPGESCYAQLRLEEPTALCTGDHFVIRDGGQQGTLGGGVILDANALPKRFRTDERSAMLNQRAEAIGNPRTLLLCELQQHFIRHSDNPLPNSLYSKKTVSQTIQKLVNEKKISALKSWVMDKTWWTNTVNEAEEIITSYHQTFPDTPAMPIEEWRQQLKKRKTPIAALDLIEEQLLKKGYQKVELGIAHQDHSLELPASLQYTAETLMNQLEAAALNPPIIADLLDTEEKQQCMKFLIRSKKVIELSPKAIITTNQYQTAKQSVIDFLTSHGKSLSSDIRDHLQTTRKILIPLLESLDNEGVTLRDGDHRLLPIP